MLGHYGISHEFRTQVARELPGLLGRFVTRAPYAVLRNLTVALAHDSVAAAQPVRQMGESMRWICKWV
jgi:hypothetical protein